jgi:hypothetical protein
MWFIEFKLPAGTGVGVGEGVADALLEPRPWHADINNERRTTAEHPATRRNDMRKLLGTEASVQAHGRRYLKM